MSYIQQVIQPTASDKWIFFKVLSTLKMSEEQEHYNALYRKLKNSFKEEKNKK